MTTNAIKPCKRCGSQPELIFDMGLRWNFKTRPYHPQVFCLRCKQSFCSCIANENDGPREDCVRLTTLQIIGRWNRDNHKNNASYS
jgi:hypothetical protein